MSFNFHCAISKPKLKDRSLTPVNFTYHYIVKKQYSDMYFLYITICKK